MGSLVVGVIALFAVAVVMVALALVAVRIRRRGSAGPALGAAMAAYDEAMNSSSYAMFVEIRAQDDRTAPAPAPGKAGHY